MIDCEIEDKNYFLTSQYLKHSKYCCFYRPPVLYRFNQAYGLFGNEDMKCSINQQILVFEFLFVKFQFIFPFNKSVVNP